MTAKYQIDRDGRLWVRRRDGMIPVWCVVYDHPCWDYCGAWVEDGRGIRLCPAVGRIEGLIQDFRDVEDRAKRAARWAR